MPMERAFISWKFDPQTETAALAMATATKPPVGRSQPRKFSCGSLALS